MRICLFVFYYDNYMQSIFSVLSEHYLTEMKVSEVE